MGEIIVKGILIDW